MYISRARNWALASLLVVSIPLTSLADDNYELLKQQVDTLQKQLADVQQALKQYESQSASKEEVAELKEEVAEAAEWKEPNTLIHMAGYADVGYANQEKSDGSFNVGTFSPIFHYQYRDLVMLSAASLMYGWRRNRSIKPQKIGMIIQKLSQRRRIQNAFS